MNILKTRAALELFVDSDIIDQLIIPYLDIQNALTQAIQVGDLDTFVYSVYIGAKIENNSLFSAAMFGRVKFIQHMEYLGVDIRAHHNLLMLWACQFKHRDLMIFLINSGAEVTDNTRQIARLMGVDISHAL